MPAVHHPPPNIQNQWEEIAVSARASYEQGDHNKAVQGFRLALQTLETLGIDDKNIRIPLQTELATSLMRLGQAREAMPILQGILREYPQHSLSHHYLASIYAIEGQRVLAIQHYKLAIRYAPDQLESYNHLGLTLQELAQSITSPTPSAPSQSLGIENSPEQLLTEALAIFEEAIRRDKNYLEAHINRGTALLRQKRWVAMVLSCQTALRIAPQHIQAHNNLGIALEALYQFNDALLSYERALQIKPDYAHGHWNYALLSLLLGKMEQGWRSYEWRWRRGSNNFIKPDLNKPEWLGSPAISGKTLLIYAEQGFGDTIQFSRYGFLLKKQGIRVLLVVQPPLYPLLRHFDGADMVISQGEKLPDFDYLCPLLSLPFVFATTLTNIPVTPPYIAASPDKFAFWQNMLPPVAGPRLGLVWFGSPHNPKDKERNIPLSLILKHLPFQFIALHEVIGSDDYHLIQQVSNHQHAQIHLYTDYIHDFSDTAALIANLTIVVTADTSVAHLAGTMGKTVFLMLPRIPDWRWLLDRNDSPWYPTMRLFRQTEDGDWVTVLLNISQELQKAGAIPRVANSPLIPRFRQEPPPDISLQQLPSLVSLPPPLSLVPHIQQPAPSSAPHSNHPDQAQKSTSLSPLDRAAELHQQGNMIEAESRYRALLANPESARNPDLLHLMGLLCAQTNRLTEAKEWMERALSVEELPHILGNYGLLLGEMKQYPSALAVYERLIKQRPRDASTYHNYSTLLAKTERLEEAIQKCDEALRLIPNQWEWHRWKGQLLHQLTQYETAIQCYQHALLIKPGEPSVLHQQGISFNAMKRYSDAMRCYDYVLQKTPRDLRVHTSRSITLRQLHRYQEALEVLDSILKEEPNSIEAGNSRANTLQAMGQYSSALSQYTQILQYHPEHPSTHWNRSLCRLLLGEGATAWDEYEWRWKVPRLPIRLIDETVLPGTLWQGENIQGKRLFLYAEQGLGDGIQFCRYIPILRQQGAIHITFLIHKELKTLIQELPGFDILTTPDLFHALEIAPYDYHAPLMSLPRWLGTGTKPINHSAYLQVNSQRQKQWQNHLAQQFGDSIPTIGLVASGNLKHHNDHNRSIPLQLLLQYVTSPALLLQTTISEQEQFVINRSQTLYSISQPFTDFADTAAVIMQLELIITVDTAVAHLAGALGKPVWLLLPFFPDWRWLLEREDSPWYPTIRLFRQKQPGQWGDVLLRVKTQLDHLISGQNPPKALNVPSPTLGLSNNSIGTQAYQSAIPQPTASIAKLFQQAFAFHQQNQYPQAEAIYRQILPQNPQHFDSLHLLGVICSETGRYEEALSLFQRAKLIKADYPDLYKNYARLMSRMKRYHDAIAAHDQVLHLLPQDGRTHFDRSLCLLTLGDYVNGWREYHWRWQAPGFNPGFPPLQFNYPPWTGVETLVGKTLYIYAEQGIGDTLQFCRFIPKIKKERKAKRVIFAVQEGLSELLKKLPGIDKIEEKIFPDQEADYHCPLLNLPDFFNIHTIPRQGPYIQVPPVHIKRWKKLLKEKIPASGPYLGLVVSGNPKYGNDKKRSMPLSLVTQTPDAQLNWVLLQTEVRTSDSTALADNPCIHHFTDNIHDFMDTAALVMNMSVVITVDTAVAHLGGALGQKTWILLPHKADWRWMQDRQDTDWYSNVRLFRQTTEDDWAGLWQQVLQALKDEGLT